ncbi:MAG: FAD-dependent oxidoreductase [Pseudomonadota bacterium]
MFDEMQGASPPADGADAAPYDLVVVGAGVAGLNALYAATEYLPSTARALLIDQKHAPGGMWNTAYDYVRLHQPHPMFTVGDMTWDWSKPRDYLARRDEVRDHLARAIGAVSGRINLEVALSRTVASCDEVQTDRGPRARLRFHANDMPEQATTVEATRAIFASGLDYRPAEPLALSSRNVVSIIPQATLETLAAHPRAPVCVVGGGKTGMDTVLAVLSQDPSRKVTLVNGRGTNFLNRTKYIPTGLARWTSGKLISRFFRDLALQFDGENEDKTVAYIRRVYSTDAGAANEVFLYGLQSEEERRRISAGLHRTHADYLTDVADSPAGPVMRFRSGPEAEIDEGSIIVNCTGSFFRQAEMADAHPLLSPGQSVLRIHPRDSFHFLTSVAGFFTTHLLYRGLLTGKGFYSLDHEGLFRTNRNAWVGASSAQAYLNQTLAVKTLPLTLLDRCGLDLDRWYPLPRRMLGLVQMMAGAKRDVAHCRKALDRVAARYGVHCAEL